MDETESAQYSLGVHSYSYAAVLASGDRLGLYLTKKGVAMVCHLYHTVAA